MKILLIRPDFFSENISAKIKEFIYRNGVHGGVLPPLGLCTVAATLEERGFDVSILDLWAEPKSEKQFTQYVNALKPNAVGIYVTTLDIRVAVLVAKKIREINPAIKIIAGGPNLSAYPKETLFHGCFDFGLMGESDFSMPMLSEKIASGAGSAAIAKVPGIVYRKGKKAMLGAPAVPVKDLDSLPFPSRHLLKGHYDYAMVSREPFTSMVASRGCPFHCAFCDKAPENCLYRERGVEKVLEEFSLVESQGFKEVVLFDDTFTLNKKRVLAICEGMSKQGIDLAWSIRSRTDTVDREMLSSLKKAGCRRLYYGVESGSDEILKLMGKRTNVAQIKKAFALSHELGFETIAYFILGFPGETEQTMQASIDLAREIKPSFSSVCTFTPLPQSRVYKELLSKRKFDEWVDFVELRQSKNPVFFGELDRKIVFAYYKKAFGALYFNPGSAWRILGLINNYTRFKNSAKAALCIAIEKLFWERGSWDV